MTAPPAQSPTDRFFPSLLDGDTDETHRLFDENGDVHDPMAGHVTEPAFYVWAASKHLWLRGFGARLEPVTTTRSGSRACAELILHFDDYRGRKNVALPVAVVGEEAGDRLVRARIYHSTWPLYGRHDLRPALLSGDPEIGWRPGDPVGAYQDALGRGDVEGVLAAFEDDAVVREPSGGEYVYRDGEGRQKLYGGMLRDGGVQLERCAVVDDGESCALEYNVLRWGKTDLLPQPGVAVYVRGPRGKLVAARIYDDVRPPAE